jgi:hypothetical protein
MELLCVMAHKHFFPEYEQDRLCCVLSMLEFVFELLHICVEHVFYVESSLEAGVEDRSAEFVGEQEIGQLELLVEIFRDESFLDGYELVTTDSFTSLQETEIDVLSDVCCKAVDEAGLEERIVGSWKHVELLGQLRVSNFEHGIGGFGPDKSKRCLACELTENILVALVIDENAVALVLVEFSKALSQFFDTAYFWHVNHRFKLLLEVGREVFVKQASIQLLDGFVKSDEEGWSILHRNLIFFDV